MGSFRMLISFLARTYNMAESLETSLPNWASFADEIVISDGGSTDGSRELAERLVGDKLVWLDFPGGSIHPEIHQNHAGKQLNYGLDHCSGEWVVTYDADAIYCERFCAHIRGTLERTTFDAYCLFGAHFVGDWNHYIGQLMLGPGMVQIFRRNTGARFPDKAEEAAYTLDIPDERVGVLDMGTFHWGYMDRDEVIKKRRKMVAVFRGTDLQEVFDHALHHALEGGLEKWKRLRVEWERCDPNCESCWMREAALRNREAMWS